MVPILGSCGRLLDESKKEEVDKDLDLDCPPASEEEDEIVCGGREFPDCIADLGNALVGGGGEEDTFSRAGLE